MIARPRTITEVQDLAKIMATSLAVPKGYQGRPADIFVAIGMGDSLGINPFQALQGIAVINGIPAAYGDLAKALIMNQPDLESFTEWNATTSLEKGRGHCEIKRKGMDVVITEFTVEQAKHAKLWTKQGPWTEYPGRQLQMRARAWCMRDAFPDALKGLRILEEVMDYNDIMAPSVSDMMPKRKEIAAPVEQPKPAEKPATITPEQVRDLAMAAAENGMQQDTLLSVISESYGVKFLYEVPANRFSDLMRYIQVKPTPVDAEVTE